MAAGTALAYGLQKYGQSLSLGWLCPPAVPFNPFGWEGSHTKMDVLKKNGTNLF